MQSVYGDVMGYVQAAENDPYARAYRSSDELFFHCDTYELVGLMCVQKAPEGGMSKMASTLAVHNALLQTKPHLLDRSMRVERWTGRIKMISARSADCFGSFHPENHPMRRSPFFLTLLLSTALANRTVAQEPRRSARSSSRGICRGSMSASSCRASSRYPPKRGSRLDWSNSSAGAAYRTTAHRRAGRGRDGQGDPPLPECRVPALGGRFHTGRRHPPVGSPDGRHQVRGPPRPFSPDGPLTWGEIDVVRTDVFNPAAIPGLLPPGP